MIVQRQIGNGLIQADFFNNSGGLNITDSPFQVRSGQAVAGYNYEYLATGGITKRNGDTVLNGTADTALRTLGLWMHYTASNTRTTLRAADTKLQSFIPTTGVTTTIHDDTVLAGNTPFSATTSVVFRQFNNTEQDVSWFAGGGQGNGVINGYNGSVYTQNGVPSPTGTISLTTSTSAFLTTTGNITSGSQVITNLASTTNLFVGALVSDGGTDIPANTHITAINGTSITISLAATATVTGRSLSFYGALPDSQQYYYAVSLVKNSTSAEGNAALDLPITTGSSGFGTSGGNTVTVSLSGLTGIDTTKYSHINIYRASVNGKSGFTIGDLAGTVASTATSFIDYGAVQQTSLPVPRNGNASLDQSTLPTTGPCNVLTTHKNRLVTAIGSTLYLSDVNKPESWPLVNNISIPTGGPITALQVISYLTPTTAVTDELLVIFKERELWIVAGNDVTDWSLQFVDYVGCVNQPLAVYANGFLFWIDYRGVYVWDGSNKPIYLSRLIEYDFSINGDLDLSKLTLGVGDFYRKQNEIVWHLSSNTLGEQKLRLKLDLRLSLPNVQQNMFGRIAEGVFIKDSLGYPVYACYSCLPTFNATFLNEVFFAGDNAGTILSLLENGSGDGAHAIDFSIRTKIENFESIGAAKRFTKVIVWVRQSTTANLTLNYWVNYQVDSAHMTSSQQQVAQRVTIPIWDVATWDAPYFDTNTFTYTPLVFNLANNTIGIEGDALTLEFAQPDFGAPMVIVGYSVIYSNLSIRK